MQQLTPTDPDTQSLNGLDENITRLKDLFPEAFSEGKLNFDTLRELLAGEIDDQPEKYGLSWNGKARARRHALTPTRATLRPDRESSVDWDTTQNLMIEGDNLEVLKLLQRSYAGKVKMIYIDPPYNTGKDFVYPDNYTDSLRNYQEITGQTEEGHRVSSVADPSGRKHTNWLNMMYPRLKLAKELLSSDGALFISIDENEVSQLKIMSEEVFGSENYLGTIIWKNANDNNPTNIAIEHECVIVIAKDRNILESEWRSNLSATRDKLLEVERDLIKNNSSENLQAAYTSWFRTNKFELGALDRYKYIDLGGIYTGSQSVHNPGREGYRYDVIHPVTKKPVKQPLMGYRFPFGTMSKMIEDGKIIFGEDEKNCLR